MLENVTNRKLLVCLLAKLRSDLGDYQCALWNDSYIVNVK